MNYKIEVIKLLGLLACFFFLLLLLTKCAAPIRYNRAGYVGKIEIKNKGSRYVTRGDTIFIWSERWLIKVVPRSGEFPVAFEKIN